MKFSAARFSLADLLPEKCVELFHLFQNGRHEEARRLQLQLVGASKLVISENGIPGLKFGMDLRGYKGGVPRPPLLPLKEEKKNAIAALVAELHPAAARV